MEISGITLYLLIISVISTTSLVSFVSMLFYNFRRKRTIGTLLLTMFFFNITLGQAFLLISFFIESFNQNANALTTIKIFQIIALLSIIYSVVWLYFFANRHLIHDNDFVKVIYLSFFLIVVGISGGLSINEILQETTNTQWHEVIPLAGTDINFYLPSLNLVTYFSLALGFLTFIRLIYRSISLQRKAKDIVTRRGFVLISMSILSFIGMQITISSFYFGVGNNRVLVILFYSLTSAFVFNLIAMSYLGWIMPEWFRRRLRGQSWFAKVYTGKIPEPNIGSSNAIIEFDTSKAVEVTEI